MPSLSRKYKTELLMIIPEEINCNPYRLLGIEVNSTPTQVRRVCEDMLSALNINHPVQRDDYLPFLQKQELSKTTIEQARRNLQDNTLTIISSFFFLVFNYPNEKQVRFELQQENLDKAINILKIETGETFGKENQNAMHDYGLLVFISANIEPDTNKAYSLYKQSIGNLIASSRILLINDDYHEKIINIILSTIAKRIQFLLDNNDYKSACKFLNLLDELPLDNEIYENIVSRPFQQLFNKITKNCQQVSIEVNKLKDGSPRLSLDKLINKFKDEILSPIQVISDVFNNNISEFQILCEEIVDCGRSITIKLHNIYDDSQYAKSLLETLIKLPASEAKLNSIKKDLLIITKHANIDLANQHINDGNWRDAEILLKLALNQTTDNEESKYINDKLQICNTAISFLSIRQKQPDLSTIWDGCIGLQIRRCLNNALLIYILGVILSFYFGYEAILNVSIHIENDHQTLSILSLLQALLFLFIVIIFLFYLLNKIWDNSCINNNFYQHPICQELSNYGQINWVIQSIENDYSSVRDLTNGYYLTQLWLLYFGSLRTTIFKTKDIIWCYKTSTKNYTNGINTGTSYGINMKLENSDYTIEILTSKNEIDKIYNNIHELLPWIIYGYSLEIEDALNRNDQKLIDDVNKQRNYLMPYIDLSYPSVLTKNDTINIIPLSKQMKLIKSVIPNILKVSLLVCIILILVISFWIQIFF
jgi:hypothetical protein